MSAGEGARAALEAAVLEMAAGMVDEASARVVRGGMTGSPTGLIIEASNDDEALPAAPSQMAAE